MPTWGISGAAADHARMAAARVPACMLSYMGQGALILDDRRATSPARSSCSCPSWARLAAGVPGHGGDGDRLAGGHHRRLLGRRAGGPARLPAAAADRAHLGGDDRPDLRAVDQLAAAGLGAHARLRVPVVGRAGVRLRHGGHRHDHDHHAAVLLHRPPPVATRRCGWWRPAPAAADGRPAVPRGQPDQAGARRVAAAADRGRPRSRSSPPGSAAASSSPSGASATRARCASSSTSCTTGGRRWRASRAPRCSSTAARRRRRWPCAPASSTSTCCTSTS